MAHDQPPPLPRLREFHFYKGRHLVLTVADYPGILLSTAAPPPSGAPQHPFLNARAYDPYSEHDLGSLLRQARNFDEYIRFLIEAGYDGTTSNGSPPMELGVGYRLEDQQGLVGVVWDSPGAFTRLQGHPAEVQSYFEHAVMTAYREDQSDTLLACLKATQTFADLRNQLELAGYRLVPLKEYTV